MEIAARFNRLIRIKTVNTVSALALRATLSYRHDTGADFRRGETHAKRWRLTGSMVIFFLDMCHGYLDERERPEWNHDARFRVLRALYSLLKLYNITNS